MVFQRRTVFGRPSPSKAGTKTPQEPGLFPSIPQDETILTKYSTGPHVLSALPNKRNEGQIDGSKAYLYKDRGKPLQKGVYFSSLCKESVSPSSQTLEERPHLTQNEKKLTIETFLFFLILRNSEGRKPRIGRRGTSKKCT